MKRILWSFFLFLPIYAFSIIHEPSQIEEQKKVLSYYPPIEPYRTGFLQVDPEHTLYWEECGNPEGVPILFLHGGPGMGTSPIFRCFFDPDYFRIILYDQRGAGKSQPFASLKNNTTWDLVEDIEKLRRFFKIDQWHVFGGSWGSTLALCYAIKHPKQVKSLILRGIYLCRKKEIDWFYQSGAHCLFPDAWQKYIEPIPEAERNNFVKAFYKRLTSPDPLIRSKAAKAWAGWEASCCKLIFDPQTFDYLTEDNMAEAFSRIECHYFIHNTFFDSDNWILDHARQIQHIPCVIIHGRYDIPCPVENAWDLHQALPQSKLEIIPNAGHASSEPGILDALIRATNSLKKLNTPQEILQ